MSRRQPCTHRSLSDFKQGGKWICSACDKIDSWSYLWSYYGQLFCKKCGCEPAIDYVACSDDCRRLLESKERQPEPVIKNFVDVTAEQDARVKRVAALDSQIAMLQARRASIKKGLSQ